MVSIIIFEKILLLRGMKKLKPWLGVILVQKKIKTPFHYLQQRKVFFKSNDEFL